MATRTRVFHPEGAHQQAQGDKLMPGPRWILHPQIRWALLDTFVIVLHLAKNRYFACVGPRDCWSRLLLDAKENNGIFLQELSEELKTLALIAFEADILIHEKSPLHDSPPLRDLWAKSILHKWPLFLAIAIRFRVKRDFRKPGGLAKVFAESERLAEITSYRMPFDNHSLHLEHFLRAETFVGFPDAPDDCLPRASSLFQYLTRLGQRCQLKIGARLTPSGHMHAWVEQEGKVLLDNTNTAEFQVVTQIG